MGALDKATIANLRSRTLTVSGNATVSGTASFRRLTDTSSLTDVAGSTITLTAAQSGTLFEIDGTENNVVNMPALSTDNAGLVYEFVVTTALAAGKTTTFVLPGSGASNFFGNLILVGDANTCTVTQDVAGDTLTLPATTVAGARVRLVCLKDDGTNSTWLAETTSTPVATIA